MTFYCFKCGATFDESEIECKDGYEVIDGRRWQNPYENEYFCPNCGASEDYFDEAGLCEVCDEAINPEKHLCDNCIDELSVYVDQMLDEYALAHEMHKEDAKEIFTHWLEDNKGYFK